MNVPKRDFQQPKQGKKWGGRKKGLSPEAIKKAEVAMMLYEQQKSTTEIAGIIGG